MGGNSSSSGILGVKDTADNSSGTSFSLCCGYGAIKLSKFKDPSPKLKELYENTSPQSRQFLANIRKCNGLVAMASRCITGKLTDFSKIKSNGPSIYKMSGQMYTFQSLDILK